MSTSMPQSQQAAASILMVRPAAIRGNEETAESNRFQLAMSITPDDREAALQEFDTAVSTLHCTGIDVHVWQEPVSQSCPDSVFPNNWLSTHADGRICLYPMMAPSRRKERDPKIVDYLQANFQSEEVVDLTQYEHDDAFLEGTGSLVLDRNNKIAYAARSARTNESVAQVWCETFGYELCAFETAGPEGIPVYHTNVLMSVGSSAAVVCFDCLKSESDRAQLRESLATSSKEVVEITIEQMSSFAGNMLQLQGSQPIWALSQSAFDALQPNQKAVLERSGELVPIPIPTIERLGGGSIRCMIAEIFLPRP